MKTPSKFISKCCTENVGHFVQAGLNLLQWRYMSVKASQITCNLLVCWSGCLTKNKENTNVAYYWPFVSGTHRWLVDSPYKGSVMQGAFPCKTSAFLTPQTLSVSVSGWPMKPTPRPGGEVTSKQHPSAASWRSWRSLPRKPRRAMTTGYLRRRSLWPSAGGRSM